MFTWFIIWKLDMKKRYNKLVNYFCVPVRIKGMSH